MKEIYQIKDYRLGGWLPSKSTAKLRASWLQKDGVLFFFLHIIESAEALPILCVRYIRWERERERERDTEKDGSDVTIVALKLAMNLHVPFAKNSHNWRWVYTFPCQKLALFVSPFTLPVSPFTERSPLWRWNRPFCTIMARERGSGHRRRESAALCVFLIWAFVFLLSWNVVQRSLLCSSLFQSRQG